MRLPTQHRIQTHTPQARPAPAGGDVQPASCCDGKVTIYSPSGDTLYSGASGCCYDSGQAYCYPCSGQDAYWTNYAKTHFAACQGPTSCAVSLTGCGGLTPYC